MEIILPQKPDSKRQETVTTNKLVVIGANGAGKSSFGKDLIHRYGELAVRISGFRCLFIRNDVHEWTDIYKSPQLSDYDKLVIRLQKEEFEAAVQYKEQSKKIRVYLLLRPR